MTRDEHRALWDDARYVRLIVEIADAIKADGCTGVPDFYLFGCLEHDIAYHTHLDPLGKPVSKWEADQRFRWYMQSRSAFGDFSPMAWWRWLAVKWFAKRAWDHE